jgi:hypothetical protein
MKIDEIFELVKDRDPRNMNLVERIVYYTDNAHAIFEEARKSLDPTVIAMAEQALFEMLEIIEKSRANIQKPENLAILQEAEDKIKADYQFFK